MESALGVFRAISDALEAAGCCVVHMVPGHHESAASFESRAMGVLSATSGMGFPWAVPVIDPGALAQLARAHGFRPGSLACQVLFASGAHFTASCDWPLCNILRAALDHLTHVRRALVFGPRHVPCGVASPHVPGPRNLRCEDLRAGTHARARLFGKCIEREVIVCDLVSALDTIRVDVVHGDGLVVDGY